MDNKFAILSYFDWLAHFNLLENPQQRYILGNQPVIPPQRIQEISVYIEGNSYLQNEHWKKVQSSELANRIVTQFINEKHVLQSVWDNSLQFVLCCQIGLCII